MSRTDQEKENIKLTDRYADEILNKGNLDLVDELLAEDYVHGSPPPGMSPDREGFKQFISGVLSAFPDYSLTVNDTIADGDKVVQRWTGTGTHKGEFMGNPATGNEVSFQGISIYQIKDGKIVKDWTIAEIMKMMSQIGKTP